MKSFFKFVSAQCDRPAAVLFFALTLSGSALAQSAGPGCISQLQKEYGATEGVTAQCANTSDCTFLAPPANASARALVETIGLKAEACLKGAGLSLAKEDKQDIGTTREFRAPDGNAKCALLISTPNGTPPEGVRVVCSG